MTQAEPAEVCNCLRPHDTVDGRCGNPPLWHDDPELDRQRYKSCGCCMADCPDVHAEPDPDFRAVPGSLVVAQEYFDTLSDEKQRALRAREACGELRIAPRSEVVPNPDRIKILPSALKHFREHSDDCS